MKRVAVFCLCIGLLGCRGSKVDQETSFNLGPGDIYSVIVDPPRKEQKVVVTITADFALTASVVLEKDIPNKDVEKYDAKKSPPLATEANKKSITLTATIPAKETFYVLFSGAEKLGKVNVTIKSQ